jgi:outer membrane biosynthesis protein TonB
MKRWRARARGRAARIRKPTCHITVKLTPVERAPEPAPAPKEEPKAEAAPKKKTASKRKPAAKETGSETKEAES